jgi:hypothetical protein
MLKKIDENAFQQENLGMRWKLNDDCFCNIATDIIRPPHVPNTTAISGVDETSAGPTLCFGGGGAFLTTANVLSE